jgi:hypothetical protein
VYDRPPADEYFEYYGMYIDRVPNGDAIATLEQEWETTRQLLESVPEDRETYRYAPGKWSVREVVGHCLDVERVFGVRALHFARGDEAPLPSFQQDWWAQEAGADDRPLQDLIAEWDAMRRSHVLMFRGIPEPSRLRSGIASGRSFSARCIPWIMAGHEIHHRTVLEELYGLGPPRK